MEHSSYENAKRETLRYAENLKNAVIDGTLNESACEGLIESFLQDKLSSSQYRSKLLSEALAVISSRKFLVD